MMKRGKAMRVSSMPSSMSRSEMCSLSTGQHFLWGLLILVLKVLGLSFLVQGFILQLATGVLYYGMLHYALGTLFVFFAWGAKWKSGCTCFRSK